MNAQTSILGTLLLQRRGGVIMSDYDLMWNNFYNEAIEKGFSKENAEVWAQVSTDDMQ